jgi:hypothetical protein
VKQRENTVTERPRNRSKGTAPTESGGNSTAFTISHSHRSIRTAPPAYRWECPCQDPAVLLATYDPAGRINIKVRDRYWHLAGFGQVQAICPRCAAEHILDLRVLHDAIDDSATGDGHDRD